MRAKLIQIGNSKGVRVPKPIIEQCDLGEEVELEVRDNTIVIRSVGRPRAGWAEEFHRMAEQSEDRLLDEDLSTSSSWDEREWDW